MTSNQLLQITSRDDQREIRLLLDRLPPRRRVRFLECCCRAASLPKFDSRPYVLPETYHLCDLARRDDSADVPLTLDVMLSLFSLATHWEFDLPKALDLLVRFARAA